MEKSSLHATLPRCLITGGGGNLGCQIAWALTDRFEQLVLLDVAARPVAPIPKNATYESIDIRDFARLANLLEEHRPAAIIHLASLLSGNSEHDVRATWHINTTVTLEILELCRALPGTRVLFASSLATYGGRLPSRLLEDQPQWPATLYGVTKIACERLGAYAREAHGVDFRCLRLPITLSRFAPRTAVSAMVSNAFIESAHSGRFTFRAGPGTKMAGLYVKDVVKGFVALLAAPRENLQRPVYNVGGFSATLAEVSEAIRRRLPQTVHHFDPDPEVESIMTSWPSETDDSNARRDWNWSPAYDLRATADDFLSELGHGSH